MSFDHKSIIRGLLTSTVATSSSQTNIFDEFIKQLEQYYTRSVSSLRDIKQRDNKRAKGLAWEIFCRDWLLTDGKFVNVWLLNDMPADLIAQLKLQKMDNGIDLVGQTKTGYWAIQCKYRKPTNKRGHTTIPWATLATFVGLCAVSGPWQKQVVMTNLVGVTRKVKTNNDFSICVGSFRSTSRERWMKLCGDYIEHRLSDDTSKVSVPIKPMDINEIRAMRLKALGISN
jgi:hypothetical protein